MFANPIQMLMSDDLPKSLPLTCLNLNSVRNRVRFSWTHCKWFLCRFSYVRTRRKWETSRNQQQQFKHAVGPHTVSYREGERARDLVGRAGILAMNKFTGMLQCGTTQEQREAKKNRHRVPNIESVLNRHRNGMELVDGRGARSIECQLSFRVRCFFNHALESIYLHYFCFTFAKPTFCPHEIWFICN